MNVQCKFCKNEFSTNKYMLRHQRNTKACLEIQKRFLKPTDRDILNTDDLVIVTRNDSYVNLTKLFNSGKEQYKRWIRMKCIKDIFLPNLSKKLKIPKKELIKTVGAQTWGHPNTVPNIINWMINLRKKRIARLENTHHQSLEGEEEEGEEEEGDEEDEGDDEEDDEGEEEKDEGENDDEEEDDEEEDDEGEEDEGDEEGEELSESSQLPLIINYKQPLVLNNIEITTRQKDGYINLSALCKAGNKKFKHWNENKKTKAFLQVLSSSVRIPTRELIKYETGSNENRATWGHPQVAINIAQWISPHFDVQVSKWIFELMLTGRVELGKEKTNEELEMIQEQRLSIGIEPYLTNDITYIFEFTPEKEHLKNSELLNDKNIHFFEIGVTSDIKERKKAYSGYKLLKVFVYSSRQKAAMAESYMKNIVVELKMTLEYKNKKECMFGTYEDLDRFIEIISEHNLNGNKEPEEEIHNNNIEMYKIQTDKEIEIKRIESEMEMEIQKNKQTSIMSLFERKLITFEQFNESFQKI